MSKTLKLFAAEVSKLSYFHVSCTFTNHVKTEVCVMCNFSFSNSSKQINIVCMSCVKLLVNTSNSQNVNFIAPTTC